MTYMELRKLIITCARFTNDSRLKRVLESFQNELYRIESYRPNLAYNLPSTGNSDDHMQERRILITCARFTQDSELKSILEKTEKCIYDTDVVRRILVSPLASASTSEKYMNLRKFVKLLAESAHDSDLKSLLNSFENELYRVDLSKVSSLSYNLVSAHSYDTNLNDYP